MWFIIIQGFIVCVDVTCVKWNSCFHLNPDIKSALRKWYTRKLHRGKMAFKLGKSCKVSSIVERRFFFWYFIVYEWNIYFEYVIMLCCMLLSIVLFYWEEWTMMSIRFPTYLSFSLIFTLHKLFGRGLCK